MLRHAGLAIVQSAIGGMQVAKRRFELSGGVWREKRRHGAGMGGRLVLIVLLGGAVWGMSRPAPSTPVTLVTAERRNLDIWVRSVGNVQAAQSVVVHPQVSGRITELLFREGQEVARGDVLARIDPTLYRAQLAQAMADRQQDEAQADAARHELRQLKAARGNTAAKQQALRSAIRQFEAAISSDAAAIEQAQSMLDNTTVTAPMAGRVGLRRVDAGNMIRPGDALVEITRMEQVSVVFSVPEQNLPAITRMTDGSRPVSVAARDITTGAVLAYGALELADNQVDSQGAVRMKAAFANEARRLWPGAMVHVQLSLGTLTDALVVPVAALVRRGSDHYVYQVDAAQKSVALRPVKLQLVQGDDAVIAQGLQPGDRLAVESSMALASDRRIQVLGSMTPAR